MFGHGEEAYGTADKQSLLHHGPGQVVGHQGLLDVEYNVSVGVKAFQLLTQGPQVAHVVLGIHGITFVALRNGESLVERAVARLVEIAVGIMVDKMIGRVVCEQNLVYSI